MATNKNDMIEENSEDKTISRRDALKRIAKTAIGAAGILAVSSCDIFYYNYYNYYNYYSNYYYSDYYYSDYYNYYDYYAVYYNYSY